MSYSVIKKTAQMKQLPHRRNSTNLITLFMSNDKLTIYTHLQHGCHSGEGTGPQLVI
jgi:hypothetical protein